MTLRKTAILGASSLAGREIVERLRRRHVAAGEIVLAEPGAEVAVITAVDDDLLLSTPRVDDALDGADVALACVPMGSDDARLVREAAAAGVVVIDLTGTLGGRAFDAWSPATLASLGAGVHAVPAASSVLTLRLGLAARAAGATGTLVATCFEGASELGRAALDEMFQQATAVLSFSQMPTAVLGRQAVHDVLSPGPAGRAAEERIRREVGELLGEAPPALLVVRPGLFHGVALALRATVDAAAWRAALADDGRLELVAEDDEGASPAAAARTERATVGRVEADGAGGAWAWAAADSLEFGAVGGTIELLARSGGGG